VLDDFTSLVREIWQHHPMIIVVLIGVVVLFALVVIDSYRHRKKQKARHPKKH
jgi:hypothetical protein